MWPMLAAMAAGSLMGAAKNKSERQAAAADMAANAEQIRYSPWTHMASQMKAAPAMSLTGDMLQGGVTGAMQMQNFQKGQQDMDKSKALTGFLERGGNVQSIPGYQPNYNGAQVSDNPYATGGTWGRMMKPNFYQG